MGALSAGTLEEQDPAAVLLDAENQSQRKTHHRFVSDRVRPGEATFSLPVGSAVHPRAPP